MAPDQVRVLPITEEVGGFANEVTEKMRAAGIRVVLDARSETLKYRIAEGARMKTPYMAVIGKREAETGTIAINVRGAGREQKPRPVPVDRFVANVAAEVRSRALTLTAHEEPGGPATD